jgi:phytoene dehydrogenase-like protein
VHEARSEHFCQVWTDASAAKTPIPGLYLASSYAGSGGFTGAILAGGTAADLIL